MRLKSCSDYGGQVSNVVYRNLTAKAVAVAIFVDMFYECKGEPSSPEPLFRDISVSSLDASTVATAGSFNCTSNLCEIELSDITIESILGFTECTNVYGNVSNVSPKPCYGIAQTNL